MLRIALRGVPALLLAGVAFATGGARAESGLLLEYPDGFGVVPASTYDLNRKQVGSAHLVIEKLDTGNVRTFVESGFTGGARTVVQAELTPVDGGRMLRPVRQESRSFDADGNALGVLTIDHEGAVASCAKPGGEEVVRLDLPPGDRVANLTLNLLFLPLVRGESEDLNFQLFLCGGGPKFIDFVANLAPGSHNGKRRGRAVEVRYGPDFGFASMVARNFVPKLSFWFEPRAPHKWMAHRLPLYGNGPEVFVVRDGIPPSWLGDE